MTADEIAAWRRARRAELVAARLALTPEHHRQLSDTVRQHLATYLEQLAPVRALGFYWPFRGEVDVRPVVQALIAGGAHAALPVVIQRDGVLAFRAWRSGERMAKDVHGIPCPADGAPVAPDILLVPLVGFDDRFFRLGYGGGYYDRTLGALAPRPQSVGIGFELGCLPSIHPAPHDIALDAIVTERGARRRDKPAP
jgi:5-formyltetrahydrofolate cyclo-ligase